MQLVKYDRETGKILATWTSNTAALVEANKVQDDPTVAHLLREEQESTQELVERWRIREGRLVEKIRLTILAEPAMIDADGTETCLVGVHPALTCTLLINGEPHPLTEQEAKLTFTSEVPMTFVIQLAPHSDAWALPITVEAR